jgi:hypothetical protein
MTNLPEFLFAGSAIIAVIGAMGVFAAGWELVFDRPRKKRNRKVAKGVSQ